MDESIEILCDGKSLDCQTVTKAPRIKEADCKEINSIMDEVVKASKANALLSAARLSPRP